MSTVKTKTESKNGSEVRFSKSQILGSEKYKNNIDLLSSMLEDDKKYSKAEVDKIISQYLKGKVK